MKLKAAAQLILLLGTITLGFQSLYTFIWSLFGFPVEWWSITIVVLAGVLSAISLFAWVWRN